MLGEERIRIAVHEVLRQVAPDADLSSLDPSRPFRDQLGIDSIDFLNFIVGLEERLAVRIGEADYPQLSSLQGCLTYLGPRVATAAGSTQC